MGGSNTMIAGAVSGLVGLALMVLETVRVLNGSSLNGLNNALLFAGLGLLALGGVLLVLAVVVDAAPASDVSGETAPVAETADDPA
jgi:hypothetical protein